MSVSKNVLSLKEKRNIIIIIGIHNCLNRDFFTKEELTIRVNEDLDDYGLKEIETYNKKYRTIEKGVKTIKETLKIEIEEKGKPVLYKYKANNVKIAKQLFLNSGMEHMVLMYDILLSLDGLSFSKFNEKILNSLDVKGYSKLKELKFYEDKDTINPLIQFESHSKFEIDQGDLFLELFDAINERKSLELKYKYFNEDNNKTYLVSPYLLKQFNKRWFLFVFNNEKKAIDYFGLARIQSIKVLSKDSFIETERKCLFGEESYFSDKVGVSKYINKYESLVENEICNVIIEIEKMQFNYIQTKPIHNSQKWHRDKGNDQYEVISINVIINFELIAMLLSFGSTIKVVEPKDLRDILIENYKKAIESYD